MKADDRETPYWIANFLAGIGMVACLMFFASCFPGGESKSPDEAVADEYPGVRSCVEQVQLLACATLEDIAAQSHGSGCGSAILGRARFLQESVEERLKSLPALGRKAALMQLRSRVMEERFGKVISDLLARFDTLAAGDRRPLESALDVLRLVARRFDGSSPTVACGMDEADSGFLCREVR